MKTYYQYIADLKNQRFFNIKESNEQDYDKLFLELAHLDELEIKFDLIKYEDYIFYFYNEKVLFDYNKRNGWFFINFDDVWSIFKNMYLLSYDFIKYIINKPIVKYFKITNIDISSLNNNGCSEVNNLFNI